MSFASNVSDGDTSPKPDCELFGDNHFMQFDYSESGPSQSSFRCPCGKQQVVFEEGTGA